MITHGICASASCSTETSADHTRVSKLSIITQKASRTLTSCKGTRRDVVRILCRDLDILVLGTSEEVLDLHKVKKGRSDDYLRVGVQFGGFEVLDQLLGRLQLAVHLPVAACFRKKEGRAWSESSAGHFRFCEEITR
jgi:hypothetical protein